MCTATGESHCRCLVTMHKPQWRNCSRPKTVANTIVRIRRLGIDCITCTPTIITTTIMIIIIIIIVGIHPDLINASTKCVSYSNANLCASSGEDVNPFEFQRNTFWNHRIARRNVEFLRLPFRWKIGGLTTLGENHTLRSKRNSKRMLCEYFAERGDWRYLSKSENFIHCTRLILMELWAICNESLVRGSFSCKILRSQGEFCHLSVVAHHDGVCCVERIAFYWAPFEESSTEWIPFAFKLDFAA